MLSIIFDVDDTLYDHAVPFENACKSVFGLNLPANQAELYQAFQKHSNEVYEAGQTGVMSLPDTWIYRISRTMEDYALKITPDQAMDFQNCYAANQDKIYLSETMKKILTLCRESGVNMGIVTNGPYEHQLKKIVALGLERWIPMEHVVISGKVGISKPHRQIFDIAEEKMSLSKKNTYFIGDSYESDMAGAIHAGWHTIWMNHRCNSLPNGCTAPDHIIKSEQELKQLLTTLIFQ